MRARAHIIMIADLMPNMGRYEWQNIKFLVIAVFCVYKKKLKYFIPSNEAVLTNTINLVVKQLINAIYYYYCY